MKFGLLLIFCLLSLKVTANKSIAIANLSKNEKNCKSLRSTMEILPAYKPVNIKISGMFKKKITRQMKSFREIILELMETIDYESDEMKDEVVSKIAELRNLKENYYEVYLLEKQVVDSDENHKKKLIEKEKKALSKTLSKLQDKQVDYEEEIESLYNEVVEFAEKEKNDDSENSFSSRMNVFRELKSGLTEAKIFFYDDDDTINFYLFIEKHFPGDKDMLRYSEKLAELAKNQTVLRQLKEAVNYYQTLSSFPKEFYVTDIEDKPDGSSMPDLISKQESNNTYKILASQEKETNKKMKKKIKNIEEVIKKKMKKMRSELKNNKDYKLYLKNIRVLKEMRKDKIRNEQEIDDMITQVQKLEVKLGTLEVKQKSHFTLSQDSSEILQKKMYILDSYKNLLPESFHNKHYKETEDLVNETTLKYTKYFGFLEKQIAKQIYLLGKKLEITDQINEIELYIDEKLGKVFAEVQMLNQGYSCFTKAQISYGIFAMMKTNIIIKDTQFLTTFLQTLDYAFAKQFIIFNYSIFSNHDFVHDLLDSINDQKNHMTLLTKKLQHKFIDIYVNNFCLLLNLYKEYTEYGNKSEEENIKTIGIGRRIGRMLGITTEKLFGLSKDTMYNEYFAFVAAQLLQMIPFLGNIPFLTSALATILCYITDYIIDLLIKLFKQAVPIVKAFLKSMRPVFFFITTNDLMDLDYKKQLLEDEEDDNDKDIMGSLDIKVDTIETAYFDILEAEQQIENNIDEALIFKNDFIILEKALITDKNDWVSISELQEENVLSENVISQIKKLKEEDVIENDREDDDIQVDHENLQSIDSNRLNEKTDIHERKRRLVVL